ncbi:MAG: DUF3189 family protein [Clostridiales bacterium]|nr:DUF3189 family protein [Clostridiales bacterium]
MRIVYYSYWGTYAAYTTAALHTGLYPKDRLPPAEWIAEQYELCSRYGKQTGNLIYVGMDDQFSEVYSLGCRRHGGMVVRAIQHISDIFSISEPVHLISTESLDGLMPLLLQNSCFSNHKLKERLFTKWFYESYPKCIKRTEKEK